ncbi:MAG: molybdate ABC transporter substrate-binding protein [Deltaproteobacteria bacterium]|jgi:molybdate transport system substrate-binding protein|nr:molybdate ABC transporter substrate-binding protein [Deltaproteobacteria bacterium]
MKKFMVFLAALAIFIPSLAAADEFYVAVASNFQVPAGEIIKAFEEDTGHKAIPSFASTAQIYSQIVNDREVDIFLSADAATPKKLEDEGRIKPGSRFTYAQGSLVLWSATEGFVDSEGQVLKTGKWEHLAVANPKLAPYGAAAYQFLEAWGLLKGLEGTPKIVTGENITQTHSLAVSGAAQLGLLALSQVYRNGKFTSGSGWVVPSDLYSPILQDAVILKTAENKAAVQAFADYLKGEKAKQIILSFGYILK